MINSYGKMKNNEPESILGDLEVPEAIADAQEMKTELKKEKNGLPKVHLFFSFDIVILHFIKH